MIHDTLANALSAIKNAEARGKDEVVVKPASKVIKAVFQILKDEDYIPGFEFIDNKKSGVIKVKLKGSINKIGVIKPRFPVKLSTLEKYEKRYLPAKDFGRLIISTPKGMMTHVDVRKNKTGGTLIAYVY